MQSARSLWPGLMVAALLVGGATSPAAAAPEPKSPSAVRNAPPSVRCDAAIQHPLRVKVTALDPPLRGEIVHVRVTAGARNPIERGEVRLTSSGSATLMGPSRVPLGRLTPGTEASAEFAVRLPAEGTRFLLQFRVTGDGERGVESRGATLNLLPDGPADPGRVVTLDSGRRIAEYRARRIDR